MLEPKCPLAEMTMSITTKLLSFSRSCWLGQMAITVLALSTALAKCFNWFFDSEHCTKEMNGALRIPSIKCQPHTLLLPLFRRVAWFSFRHTVRVSEFVASHKRQNRSVMIISVLPVSWLWWTIDHCLNHWLRTGKEGVQSVREEVFILLAKPHRAFKYQLSRLWCC